jgi:endonuclease/exonuclease/phosphatase family metal-dependent hydrolase
VKVISFNLRFASADDGANSWPFRHHLVIETLRRYAPDLFGVQEAQEVQVKYLAQELPHYRYIGVGRDDGATQGEYSAIFYNAERYTCLHHETFWLSETPTLPGSLGWDANNIRVCTWGEFQEKGREDTFFFFNTHLDHRGEQAQLEGTRLILHKIAQVAGGRPVILTGDFNCTADSPPYRLISSGEGGIRLNDAALISRTPPTGPQWTFHGFNPPGSHIIDFIFVGNVRAVESFAHVDDQWDGQYPSDHLPVMAEIEKE